MNHRVATRWLLGLVLILSLSALTGQSTLTQGASPPYPLGDIPLAPETYQKHLLVFRREMADFLPTAYDARSEGIVTPAKNQGACGSCWAFATTGAMESHLLKAQYLSGSPDLSEQQQVSCNTGQLGCCGGSSNSIQFWESQGPIYESCFPYGDGGTSCPTESNVPCDYSCQELPYRVTNYYTVSPTPDQFKSSLYNYGPSYWRFDVYTDFDAYWSGGELNAVYVNQGGSRRGGHAVLLIGWDDTKGAYLCKNSWGTNGGPNGDGTFWIAYSGHHYNLGFGMANFSVTSPIACYNNGDCDDGNGCTLDICQNPGTSQASCQSTWAACDLEASDGCCGPDCTAETDIDCTCGNGFCDGPGFGEDCNTCPEDCPSGTGGGSCSACFKGVCDGQCHPVKEGPECSDCAPGWCCGDGVCSVGETSANCPIDCPLAVCGDGTCDPGEDQCSCAVDCGLPPATETNCSDGLDDDCDNLVDCDDADCNSSPACTCLARGEICTEDSECCSNRCHRGTCK